MNNKEVFVEKLNSCGEIKYEVSQVHNRIMGKIKNIYALVFKQDKKNFVALKNMKFYQAGVQDNESCSKLQTFLNSFVSLVNQYDFLKDKTIVEYLAESGIKLELLTPNMQDDLIEIDKEETKNFEKAWSFAMAGDKVPATKKELMDMILKRSLETQKNVSEKQELIDDGAENVSDSCNIKKVLFMKALSIKCKDLQKRSVDNELVKIEDDMSQTQDVVNVFKENLKIETNEPIVEKDIDDE